MDDPSPNGEAVATPEPANLAAIPPAETVQQRLIKAFTTGGLGYFSPLQPNKEADAMLMFRALGQCDATFDSLIGEKVQLRTFCCFPVDVMDAETGEVRSLIRSVLILDDGRCVGCCSEGVLKALKALASLKGMGPWEPPLSVQLRQVGLKNGNRLFTLDWIAGTPPAVERKEGKRHG